MLTNGGRSPKTEIGFQIKLQSNTINGFIVLFKCFLLSAFNSAFLNFNPQDWNA